MIVPRSAVTPPPAPPAYRPPSYYEDSGRRRSPWPMILGIVAVAIAAVGGYLVYQKVNTAIDKNAPVAVQNVELSPVKNAELILHQQGLQTHTVTEPSDKVAEGLVVSQDPAPGHPRGEGDDRHADRLERRAEDDRPGAHEPPARRRLRPCSRTPG